MTEINLPPTLEESLKDLLKRADGKTVEMRLVLQELAGRGYPILLIIIGLPFCLPIQLPGLSTPFGLLLAFMGIRMTLGKDVHWPEFLLKRHITYPTLETIVHKVLAILKWGRRYIRPRFSFLVQDPWLHRLHGFLLLY